MLTPVTPYTTQRNRNTPVPGAKLTVTFDGEVSQVEVEKVSNPNFVFAKCLRSAVSRNGGFKKDDIVACRRVFDETLQVEKWEHVTDREWRQMEMRQRLDREEADRYEREQKAAVTQQQAEADAHAAAVFAAATAPPEPAPRKVLGPRRSKVSRPA